MIITRRLFSTSILSHNYILCMVQTLGDKWRRREDLSSEQFCNDCSYKADILHGWLPPDLGLWG